MLASRFSTRNHDALRELFTLLGAPFSETDPAANAATAKLLWLNEHRQINAQHSVAELLRVPEIGARMGLVGANLPESGLIAGRTIHNPGGTVRAMIKRFRQYKELEESGEQPGTFICWAGQRLRDLKLGETVDELVEFIKRENPAMLDHPWVQDELAKDDSDSTDRYERPFATETEIMILCALVSYGDRLELQRIKYIDEPSQIDGVPGRKVLYYHFTRAGRADIFVLNGAAVRRYNGKGEEIEPRPTAASTAREVAEIWGFDGVEGLMVSNPHSERLALEIDHIVRQLGFNPTFVVYGLPGPDAADDAAKIRQANTILGEVARILTIEQQFANVAV